MKRRAWIVLLALLLIPLVPGLADARDRHRGGHGYKRGHGHKGGYGHGYRAGHGHKGGHGHSYRGGYGYDAWYGPWWYPAYYAYPYLYPYPYRHETRVIVEETPVYVERPQRAAPRPAPPEQAYWYYCESLRGYYPDVAKCPEDWLKVLPRPD